MEDDERGSEDRHRFCVIGAGAVGSSLAMRLRAGGHDVAAVISRSQESAMRLASDAGAGVASTSLSDLPPQCDAVVLCTPDDALDDVAQALARVNRAWRGTIVMHTSGAISSRCLRPLAERGARTLSFHPVQTFPKRNTPQAFDGIFIGVEGSDAACAIGFAVAKDLGARAVRISTADKTRYHLAATMASNFCTTLLALVEEVSAARESGSDWDFRIFGPLVTQTVENAMRDSPRAALTGPVARGDAYTIQRHLQALRQDPPPIRRAYRALASATLQLARSAGHLDAAAAHRIETMLRADADADPDHTAAPAVSGG